MTLTKHRAYIAASAPNSIAMIPRADMLAVPFARRHWADGTDQWIAVPNDRIIAGGSPVGMAVAWISSGGMLYCLALGAAG